MANYEFKIILVGDAGVGKTTMVAGLLGHPLPQTYVQTQGILLVFKKFLNCLFLNLFCTFE